jgi:hypothetical protein
MAEPRKPAPADTDAQVKSRPPAIEDGAKRRAKALREAQRQMTPQADVDDTVEGEGSPGLTIGGGGHA